MIEEFDMILKVIERNKIRIKHEQKYLFNVVQICYFSTVQNVKYFGLTFKAGMKFLRDL